MGKPTDVPWAFVFERVDMVPRHPAQLYEAIAYFIFFLVMIFFQEFDKETEYKYFC
ncbi:prolipoprotein diacylglyceryl transferase [Guyparkeria sp. 1SP6A2]|nr:prolipoprotein diacylglyceryl transferase [Guyparkeria sp. 1SP6A2]